MSDLAAMPVFINDAQPMAVIDDAAFSRAQDVLAGAGISVDPDVLQQAPSAAVTPSPDDAIPVSLGMVDAGRAAWASNLAGSPHVLLPAIYRAMDQKRQDETAAVAQQVLVLAR